MPETDHSDVGFVPTGDDHSDVGFVPADDSRSFIGKILDEGAASRHRMAGAAADAMQSVFPQPGGPDVEGMERAIGMGFGMTMPEIPGVDKAGKWIAGKVGSAADALGVSMGRRAITGGASLQNATREALPDQAVRAAYDEGAIKAGSSTQGIADRLQTVRDQLGSQKERILIALKQAGITGPNAEALADRMAMEGRTAAVRATNPGVRAAYDTEAGALRATETPHGSDFTVPRDQGGNLDLLDSEARKTAAMNDASYGNYSDTAINQAKQGVGNIYKTANEEAITQGAAASGNPATQAIADQFQPLKARLGNVIAASDVANIGAGRAMNRAVISPKTAAFTAAKMASGAGIPDAALTAGVTGLAMSRGTSAMSAAGFGTASAMQKLQSIVRTNPGMIGRYGAILSKALSEGDQSFAANTYALSQSDPQFQALQRQLNGEK